MDELFSEIINAFDIRLMFSITIITYLILKLLDKFKFKNSKIIKHIITLLITAALSLFYFYILKIPLEKIIPTYLLATAFYNSIISYIMGRFNLGYKSSKRLSNESNKSNN